jgi:hypothetical protein
VEAKLASAVMHACRPSEETLLEKDAVVRT